MEDIYLSEISEVIYSAAMEPGATICLLSEKTGVTRDAIRSIFQYFNEYPFGGIEVSYSGVPKSIDIFDLSDEMLDEVVRWDINITNMDKVPVENLDEEEAYVLISLLNGISGEELKSAVGCLSRSSRDTMIFTKGIGSDTLGIFRLNQYPVIKKALLKRITINAVYGEEEEAIAINPLGVVFHSEENNWYLICETVDGSIHPYEVEKLGIMKLGKDFSLPAGFDMRSFLRRYFGMEIEKGEYVEAIFKDEANVIEKARRRLDDKGEFTVLPDGSMEFKGQLVGMEDFKHWMLGFGSSVILKEPKWLREEIVKEYEGILDNYHRIEHFKNHIV
ncbi:MAG TPA: WYL domain-containing protein [Clostridia bacterium]|nr:WYL domain-containing protein [Clostridia bacterium]